VAVRGWRVYDAILFAYARQRHEESAGPEPLEARMGGWVRGDEDEDEDEDDEDEEMEEGEEEDGEEEEEMEEEGEYEGDEEDEEDGENALHRAVAAFFLFSFTELH
jgi:hypothetical protein